MSARLASKVMGDQTDLSIPSLESPRLWEPITFGFLDFLVLGDRLAPVIFDRAIEWQNGE